MVKINNNPKKIFEIIINSTFIFSKKFNLNRKDICKINFELFFFYMLEVNYFTRIIF